MEYFWEIFVFLRKREIHLGKTLYLPFLPALNTDSDKKDLEDIRGNIPEHCQAAEQTSAISYLQICSMRKVSPHFISYCSWAFFSLQLKAFLTHTTDAITQELNVSQWCCQALVIMVKDTAQDFRLRISGKMGAKDTASLLARTELEPMVQSFSGSDLDST